jgi:hypothetical protein
LDRKRKKKTSNTDWTNPHDPDAKVMKMKNGRTHLAHKAEHAVDVETGAIVAVTVQGADEGDTTSIIETAIAAAEQVETRKPTSRSRRRWKRSWPTAALPDCRAASAQCRCARSAYDAFVVNSSAMATCATGC